MTDTTGKVVTLPKGIIVTDCGPWVDPVDGRIHEHLRKCVTDSGEITQIIDWVIDELPVTHRRDSLPKWIY